jgi:chemotaxis protein methyltransferase CheR
VTIARHTFDSWRRIVRGLCGLDVPEDKAYLFEQRLVPVADSAGCRDLDEFARRLEAPGGAAFQNAVVDAITTNETSFFRDTHPFDALRTVILPRLATRPRPPWHSGPRVRVWCAAASTGQEPYSLAMTVLDFLAANPACGLTAADFRILGTDVSPRVLAAASAGVYPERETARGLNEGHLRRFFVRRGDDWAVRPEVRQLVEYRLHNLTRPTPLPGPFDLILCRNVLIYFDTATRRRVCDTLADALAPDGYLILGAAESLYGVSERFASRSCAGTVLYEKRG